MFGNALGNAAVGGIQRWQSNRAQRGNDAASRSFGERYPNALAANGAGSGDALHVFVDGEMYERLADGSVRKIQAESFSDDHVRLYADDEALRQSQADMDLLRSQCRDMSAAQAALDEMWTRQYVGGGDGGLEIEIVGGTRDIPTLETVTAVPDYYGLATSGFLENISDMAFGTSWQMSGVHASDATLPLWEGGPSLTPGQLGLKIQPRRSRTWLAT